MDRYEYCTGIYPGANWLDIQKHLNELGENGWELIAIDNNNVYIFKRIKRD